MFAGFEKWTMDKMRSMLFSILIFISGCAYPIYKCYHPILEEKCWPMDPVIADTYVDYQNQDSTYTGITVCFDEHDEEVFICEPQTNKVK